MVFHGDTLYAYSRVLEKRESDREDAGIIVRFKHWGVNQNKELVAELERTALIKKKEPLAYRGASRGERAMTMHNAHGQPRRRRRCQLSVPASNTKMIEKAVSKAAWITCFWTLEDACAPNQKVSARDNVIDGAQRARLGQHSPLRAHQRYRYRSGVTTT